MCGTKYQLSHDCIKVLVRAPVNVGSGLKTMSMCTLRLENNCTGKFGLVCVVLFGLEVELDKNSMVSISKHLALLFLSVF